MDVPWAEKPRPVLIANVLAQRLQTYATVGNAMPLVASPTQM